MLPTPSSRARRPYAGHLSCASAKSSIRKTRSPAERGVEARALTGPLLQLVGADHQPVGRGQGFHLADRGGPGSRPRRTPRRSPRHTSVIRSSVASTESCASRSRAITASCSAKLSQSMSTVSLSPSSPQGHHGPWRERRTTHGRMPPWRGGVWFGPPACDTHRVSWSPDHEALRGRVAVVAGATRGAGRGIATALGEAGATVICTGRSSVTGAGRRTTTGPRRSRRRPDSSPASAAPASPCGRPPRPRPGPAPGASASATTTATSTCWSTTSGAPSGSRAGPPTGTPPSGSTTSTTGLRILRLGLDTHLITSHHLLPLLIEKPGGLLVEVTDGTADVQRRALPDLGLLRPGQGRGEPAGLLPGP